MIRILIYLALMTCIAIALAWFIDQPGSVQILFASYELLFSPMQFLIVTLSALVILIVGWVTLYKLINTPHFIISYFKKRREKTGLAAIASGLIAVSIGDRGSAAKFASLARSSLPNNPLTDLLRAQSAQLLGDRVTARRIYEGMLSAPDTEILGLRGLFLEAQQENEDGAALQFASRAAKLNPKLSWPLQALFDFQCRTNDWEGALRSVESASQNKLIDRATARRRRAILLTAQAKDLSDRGENMDKAIELATEAHNLAPDLVPAAEIASRLLASKGSLSKAAKILTRTWKQTPHPDLANVYAYARPGDSPHDRLERVQSLAKLTPDHPEGFIAVALCAIEAQEWAEARKALSPFLHQSPSTRICTLMARLESEEHGDTGKVREWLSRALRAPKDPVWTADGQISEHWFPVSPVSGKLDQFEWKIPVQPLGKNDAYKIEQVSIILDQIEKVEKSNSPYTLQEIRQIKNSDFTKNEQIVIKNNVSHETSESIAKAYPEVHSTALQPEPVIFVSPKAPDDPGDGRKNHIKKKSIFPEDEF